MQRGTNVCFGPSESTTDVRRLWDASGRGGFPKQVNPNVAGKQIEIVWAF